MFTTEIFPYLVELKTTSIVICKGKQFFFLQFNILNGNEKTICHEVIYVVKRQNSVENQWRYTFQVDEVIDDFLPVFRSEYFSSFSIIIGLIFKEAFNENHVLILEDGLIVLKQKKMLPRFRFDVLLSFLQLSAEIIPAPLQSHR